MVIPSTITGLPVTSLGDYAFWNCTSLTGVTLPNGITNVGEEAFEGCTGLTSVTIPNSVTKIGDSAFESSGLSSITIPNGVTSIGESAFSGCTNLTSFTIGNGVTSIPAWAFASCTSLTNITIPNGVTSIAAWAFQYCTSLSNVTIPSSVTSIEGMPFYACTSLPAITVSTNNPVYSSLDGILFNKSQTTLIQCPDGKAGNYAIPSSVTSIGYEAFYVCERLTSVTIPNSVTTIGAQALYWCTSLTNVTIGTSVTSIGDLAFCGCSSLTGVYFRGNAPSLAGAYVFESANSVTVYYLPGTTGWGTTFGGRPTARWIQVPTVLIPPQTQTAEAGSPVGLWVRASSPLPLFYLWYLNGTNLTSCSTNCELELTDLQFSQSGAYTVVISNALGTVTSAPVMLQVIAAVERRPVPGVKVTGQTGSLLNVDYANSLSPTPNWTPLGSVSLTSASGYCFDLPLPLPPQRFYRAWQTGTPGVAPSLSLPGMVPAITLTGSIGDSWRVDYINRFGPTDAWVTLATVTLTNTPQLYFDVSAPGQPQRLYRLVQVP